MRPALTDEGRTVEAGTSEAVAGIWAPGAASDIAFTAGLATVDAVGLAASA